MFLYFCPIEVSQNTEETPKHLKNCFTFAPFQPISAPFAPVRGAPIVQRCKERKKGTAAPLPLLPVVLMLPRNRGRTEAGKPNTTQQNEEHNRTSRPDGAGVVGVLGVLPMLLAPQERKPTRQATRNEKKGSEAERKKGSDKPTSPQAHKKGVPPP